MKRKKFEMEWFVYVYGLNCTGFQKMNIFNHFRFEECTIKHLRECSTKEEFAERISREFTDDTDFDWNGFYEKMNQRYRKFEDSIKFDVNDQVQYNFENFVVYCWNSK